MTLALLLLFAASAAAQDASQPSPMSPDYALSAAELENLGLSTTHDGETAALDTSTRINGFVDFSMFNVFTEAWRKPLQPHASFFIGNFNVYISKNLTDAVRMFAEVRFTYLPNGVTDLATNVVTSTVVPDYTNVAGQLKWGGIEIERVYLEWSMFPWLTLRAGQFLTPYGIWNVDHGSPTIIPVMQPHVIGQQLFPERQTGLELRGQLHLSASHTLGYHLTLSNGIGPAAEYADFDDNKALGTRVFWSYDGFGQLTVGASGFFGTNANAQMVVGIDASSMLSYTERVLAKSRVASLAADIQWRYDALILQAEIVARQNAFTDDGRPVSTHPLTGIRAGIPDSLDFGYYVLAGYRFEWLGIMPFVVLHHIDYLESRFSIRPNAYVLEAGLNIRPIESVVLKVQFHGAYYPEGFVVSSDTLQSIFVQLAWAF